MWIKQDDHNVRLFCVLQPRSSKNEIVGLHGDPPRLRIRITAAPVDGEANEALIAFLGKILKISKSQIQIKTGTTGKYKELVIFNAKIEDLQPLLIK